MSLLLLLRSLIQAVVPAPTETTILHLQNTDPITLKAFTNLTTVQATHNPVMVLSLARSTNQTLSTGNNIITLNLESDDPITLNL